MAKMANPTAPQEPDQLQRLRVEDPPFGSTHGAQVHRANRSPPGQLDRAGFQSPIVDSSHSAHGQTGRALPFIRTVTVQVPVILAFVRLYVIWVVVPPAAMVSVLPGLASNGMLVAVAAVPGATIVVGRRPNVV